LRIGWLGDLGGYLPMEQGVLALCRDALGTFGALGCEVAEVQPGFAPERLWQTWLCLRHWTIASIAGALYAKPELRAQLKPEAAWEIEGGLPLTGLDVSAALGARADWYRAVLALFERVDFLALPSAQVFPFPAGLHWPKAVAGSRMDTYHRWMEVVIGGTLSGCPVVNVPVGFGKDGLPMGLQLIGPARADMALLRLAAAYEGASGWTRREPPQH
jgi:amidase